MSLASRLFNVFATPGDVFEEVKAAPPSTANWLVPSLIFILVSWLGAWLIFSQPWVKNQFNEMSEKAIEKQIEKGKITKEQAAGARQVAEKFSDVGAKIGAAVVPVIIAFVSPFWWGLFLWLAGTKALKGSFPFMKVVEVVGLANMIGVLAEIVRVLLVVSLGNIFAAPGLVLLLKDADPQSVSFAILSVFNVMLFWEMGVRSVGLARISNASFAKAAVWVFGLWAVLMGLMIGLGQGLRIAFGG